MSTLNDRDTAIVGYSGGVDSALVLAMLLWFKRQPGSNLKHVVAMSLSSSVGQTGFDATRKAFEEMRQRYGAEVTGIDCPITADVQAIAENLAFHAGKALRNLDLFFKPSDSTNPLLNGPEDFIVVQALPLIRQTYLYTTAAALSTRGYKPYVAGTINRVEKMIGFFGKASEGACDSQFITDLCKSQVRDLARYLGVPEHICARKATGDVPGWEDTEQMMGFTYNEFEAYLDSSISETERSKLAVKIEHWFNTNAHKTGYFVNELTLAREIIVWDREQNAAS